MILGCLYLCNMWSVLPYLSSLSLPSVLSVHIFSIWPCPDCFVYYCYHPVISAMLCIRMALAALEMTKKSPKHIIHVWVPVSNPSIFIRQSTKASVWPLISDTVHLPCCHLWSLHRVDSSLLCHRICRSDENLLLHPYRHPADIWDSLAPVRIFRQTMGHLNWSRTVFFEKAKPWLKKAKPVIGNGGKVGRGFISPSWMFGSGSAWESREEQNLTKRQNQDVCVGIWRSYSAHQGLLVNCWQVRIQ